MSVGIGSSLLSRLVDDDDDDDVDVDGYANLFARFLIHVTLQNKI